MCPNLSSSWNDVDMQVMFNLGLVAWKIHSIRWYVQYMVHTSFGSEVKSFVIPTWSGYLWASHFDELSPYSIEHTTIIAHFDERPMQGIVITLCLLDFHI